MLQSNVRNWVESLALSLEESEAESAIDRILQEDGTTTVEGLLADWVTKYPETPFEKSSLVLVEWQPEEKSRENVTRIPIATPEEIQEGKAGSNGNVARGLRIFRAVDVDTGTVVCQYEFKTDTLELDLLLQRTGDWICWTFIEDTISVEVVWYVARIGPPLEGFPWGAFFLAEPRKASKEESEKLDEWLPNFRSMAASMRKKT